MPALTLLLAAASAAAVPVHDAGAWQDLEFRRIPPNSVSFSSAGIRIAVAGSASPLIYPLPAPAAVSRVTVALSLKGGLRGQGAVGVWDEDSQFRLGLVRVGDRRLDAVRRALAPAWVRRLFSLAPPGGGVSRIEFLMLGRPPARVGDRRAHPSSDLLEERVVWLSDGRDGRRVLAAEVAPGPPVAALWLSADGDDTGSRYEVLVESIDLAPAGTAP